MREFVSQRNLEEKNSFISNTLKEKAGGGGEERPNQARFSTVRDKIQRCSSSHTVLKASPPRNGSAPLHLSPSGLCPSFAGTLANTLPGRWDGTGQSPCNRNQGSRTFSSLRIWMTPHNDFGVEPGKFQVALLHTRRLDPRVTHFSGVGKETLYASKQCIVALETCKENPHPLPWAWAPTVSSLLGLTAQCLLDLPALRHPGNSRGKNHARVAPAWAGWNLK